MRPQQRPFATPGLALLFQQAPASWAPKRKRWIISSLRKELNQALERHELIKIKIQVGDRELRQQVADELCLQSNAECVQRIGNVAVLFRAAKEPNPKLSNLLRYQ